MEIAPGVHALGQWLGGHVHAFLLEDGEELTLIDTLFDVDGHRVLAQLARLGRRVEQLRHIVLTHAHRSHLGGLAELKRASGATIYAHEWEADIIAGDREAQRVSPAPRGPWGAYPFQLGLAIGRGAGAPPAIVDRTLRHGDRVGPVEVLHAPGHTPGHLAFYRPESGVLFAGDVIATWPEFAAGWPGLNLNVRQLRTSVRRLAELEPQVVAVGHGEPLTRGAAARLKQLAMSL
jgi:glyoxylase-like metal-dependent hydrolase (beta-lactamase superfamily II)